ncbi:MAG: Gfo/Idh/MocA family protein [Limisphaerales bacterium]
MKKAAKRNDALQAGQPEREFAAPKLRYQPPQPRRYRPRIGLIGCGGITAAHLDAYRAAGWDVAALCDQRAEAAGQRRDDFFPRAEVFTDYRRLLERTDVDVVDIALHPEGRVPVIEDALRAGKHVLSQKPFVTELADGRRLVRLADRCGRRLAVNQNGRWAPYVSWTREAIRTGMLGEVQSVAMTLNWDHTWIRGTAFEQVRHIVLYDFAIHWFDMTACFLAGQTPRRVFAANAIAPGQELKPPMLGSVAIQFEAALATLQFDAHSRFGPEEALCVTGSEGTVHARGPICRAHDLSLHTRRGVARPRLEGKWFNDGFRGAMGELLCAIEEDREPAHSARDNLRGLALCFAALRSADRGVAIRL